eukprot:TRINITY_DN13233_c0_g1_i1.p1 TRINITY_DN13233_c0_g1~~TRINITY_DN13233_c0_g1_i1.p1  ORF type:complete len:452 (+),score=108.99 TRINITY_DN13233_c0_g1_i1:42-1397(+)
MLVNTHTISTVSQCHSFSKGAKRNYSDYRASLRKQRIREQIKVKTDADIHGISFPDQRLGNNYDLNKTFVKHGVLVREGDAFHNLHSGHLLMFTEKIDESRSAVVESAPLDAVQQICTDRTKEGSLEGMTKIDIKKSQEIVDSFLDEMSWSQNFFMNDGFLGSSSPSNSVRFITNDAATSLFVQKLLQPSSPNFQNFDADTLIYHAPNITLKNVNGPAVFFGLHAGEDLMDLLTGEHLAQLTEEDKEAALKKKKFTIVLAGTHSLETIQEALLASGSYFNTLRGGAAVNASTLNINGKSVLVFNNSDVFGTGILNQHMFSQDHSVLFQNGVTRMFNNIHFKHNNTHGLTAQKGDILIGKDYCQTTHARDLVAPSPSAIIELNYNFKGKTATKKVDTINPVLSTSKLATFQSVEQQTSLYNEVTQNIPSFQTTLKKVDELEGELTQILSSLA